MKFSKVLLSSSPKASELLSQNALSISKLKEGEWLALQQRSKPQAQAFAFSLSFADFHASTNEEYEFLTQSINPLPHYEFWKEAADCISVGSVEEVRKLEAPSEAWTSADPSGQSLLHVAASSNQPQICTFLLEKGLSVNATDNSQQTAAHAACARGAKESLQVLLQASNELVNKKDKAGQAPLHVIARYGHKDCLQILLDHKADINVQDNHDYTPLFIALHHRQEDLAELLILNERISLYCITEEGQTTLMEAIENRQTKLAQLQLKIGARHQSQRRDGFDARLLAAKVGDLETLKLLLKDKSYSIPKLPSDETALHLAVKSGNLAMCEMLTTERVELLAELSAGARSPLLLALLRGEQQIALSFIKTISDIIMPLIERENYATFFVNWAILQVVGQIFGEPVALKLTRVINNEDIEKITPFIAACNTRSFAAATELLKLRVEVPAFEKIAAGLAYAPTAFIELIQQRKPLSAEEREQLLVKAAGCGNSTLVLSLLPHNMPKDEGLALKLLEACLENNLVFSARAVLRAHPQLIQSCHQGGIIAFAAKKGCHHILPWAMQNYKTQEALMTAMEMASQAGHISCVELLMRQFETPAIALNDTGMNAAHIAARHGHKKLVKYFLTHGFSSQDQDATGNDVLDHALMSKSPKIVVSLLDHGHQVRPLSLSKAIDHDSLLALLKSGNFSQQDLSFALIKSLDQHDPTGSKLLLEHGAEVDVIADGKWSALTYAAAQGYDQALVLLLPHSTHPEHIADGKNSLHHAVAANHLRCVELLLSAGFSRETRDSSGKRCIDLASGSAALLELLERPDSLQQKIDEVQQLSAQTTPQELLQEAKARQLPYQQALFLCPDGKERPLLFAALFNTRSPVVEKMKVLKELFEDAVNSVDKDLNTLAHLLATVRNPGAMTEAVKGMRDVDCKNALGQTALHIAIIHNEEENVRILLEAGANPNAEVVEGVTALSLAVGKGNVYVVKMLLKASASFTACKDPVLHIALDAGNEEMAFFLIQNGANTRHFDKNGNTPAHSAASKGCTAFLRYLKEHNDPLDTPNKRGSLPLHVAASSGETSAIAILPHALHHTRVTTKKRPFPSPQELAARSGNLSALDAVGQPTHILPLERDNLGGVLAGAVVSRVHENIEKLLQTPLADDLYQIRNAILLSVEKDDVVTLDLIREKGIHLALFKIDGRNALHWAAAWGSHQAAAYLLQHGVDGTLPDEQGFRPLQIAAMNDNPVLLRQLLETLPVPEDSENRTLLHYAAAKGALHNLAILTDARFDVQARDIVGWTPLHEACRYGHYSCMELLLLAGADPQGCSLTNKRPADLIPGDMQNVRDRWNSLVAELTEHSKNSDRLTFAKQKRFRGLLPLLKRIHQGE